MAQTTSRVARIVTCRRTWRGTGTEATYWPHWLTKARRTMAGFDIPLRIRSETAREAGLQGDNDVESRSTTKLNCECTLLFPASFRGLRTIERLSKGPGKLMEDQPDGERLDRDQHDRLLGRRYAGAKRVAAAGSHE